MKISIYDQLLMQNWKIIIKSFVMKTNIWKKYTSCFYKNGIFPKTPIFRFRFFPSICLHNLNIFKKMLMGICISIVKSFFTEENVVQKDSQIWNRLYQIISSPLFLGDLGSPANSKNYKSLVKLLFIGCQFWFICKKKNDE